eukprot:13070-Heterococcus_DN1.PRE.2
MGDEQVVLALAAGYEDFLEIDEEDALVRATLDTFAAKDAAAAAAAAASSDSGSSGGLSNSTTAGHAAQLQCDENQDEDDDYADVQEAMEYSRRRAASRSCSTAAMFSALTHTLYLLHLHLLIDLRGRRVEDANGTAAGGGSSASTAATGGDRAVQGGARRQAYVSVITTFSSPSQEICKRCNLTTVAQRLHKCCATAFNGCTTAAQRLLTVGQRSCDQINGCLTAFNGQLAVPDNRSAMCSDAVSYAVLYAVYYYAVLLSLQDCDEDCDDDDDDDVNDAGESQSPLPASTTGHGSNVGHADDSDVGLQMALSEQFLRGSAAVTSTGLNFSPAGSLDSMLGFGNDDDTSSVSGGFEEFSRLTGVSSFDQQFRNR